MALVALGEIGAGDPRAAEALQSALTDDAPAIRFQALIAAHRLLGDAAQEQIERKMEDTDPLVRAMALRISEERATLGGAAPPASVIAAAKRALRDKDLSVRLAAAIFLAKLGDHSGDKALVAALNARRGTLAPEDEQAAIELCADLGLDSARPALERRAFGIFGATRDPFAWHARIALARLGDARAKHAILRGLEAWSRDTRTLAVVAAGRAALSDARSKLLTMRGDLSRADPDAVAEALTLLG
jgi:HEAT repeat protein